MRALKPPCGTMSAGTANITADAVWAAYEKSQEGTVLGTIADLEPCAAAVELGLNSDSAKDFRK